MGPRFDYGSGFRVVHDLKLRLELIGLESAPEIAVLSPLGIRQHRQLFRLCSLPPNPRTNQKNISAPHICLCILAAPWPWVAEAFAQALAGRSSSRRGLRRHPEPPVPAGIYGHQYMMGCSRTQVSEAIRTPYDPASQTRATRLLSSKLAAVARVEAEC